MTEYKEEEYLMLMICSLIIPIWEMGYNNKVIMDEKVELHY